MATHDELIKLADGLEAKALTSVKEVVSSVLGARTYHTHLEFAERALRIADRLRLRASEVETA